MEPPTGENLVQALGRGKRPSLLTKNGVLFDEGLHSKEVIELSGPPGIASYRTTICLDLMAKCLLPVKFHELDIGGFECGVVLLDADHHIDVFKLVQFLEARVMERLPEGGENIVEEIVKLALKKLAIIQVFNHLDLLSALQSAKNYIFHHREVSLVVLDSISATYWTNVASGGIRQINRFVDDILKNVCKHLGSYEISFLYTRSGDFYSKSGPPSDLNCHYGLQHVNTRIQIHPGGRLDIYKGSKMRIVFFEITSDGVKYSPS